MAEFSLDKEDSALSRMADRSALRLAQNQHQQGVLAGRGRIRRLRGCRRDVDGDTGPDSSVTSVRFQEEVKVALAEMKPRDQARIGAFDTRHGLKYSRTRCSSSSTSAARRAGDVATRNGDHTTGILRANKKGDVQLSKLGPDHSARQPVRRIVDRSQAGWLPTRWKRHSLR